jgi:hypothetical protein
VEEPSPHGANHVGQILAADFFIVPTATYRLLFVMVILAHDRRRIRVRGEFPIVSGKDARMN